MDIPRRLMQTGHMAVNASATSRAWQVQNPDFEYHYFNDQQCEKFLQEHLGSDVVQAFRALQPGAFKADLFRYAFLYVRGGVYIDLDMAPVPPHTLDKILRCTPRAQLVACVERAGIRGVWQGFLACVPGLPCLRDAIDKIVHHTRTRYYPAALDTWDAYLSITGPVLLARAMPGVAFRPGAQTVGGTRVYLHTFNDHVVFPGTQDVVISGEDADYTPKDNYGYLTLVRQVYA